jgi:hypothetical protein
LALAALPASLQVLLVLLAARTALDKSTIHTRAVASSLPESSSVGTSCDHATANTLRPCPFSFTHIGARAGCASPPLFRSRLPSKSQTRTSPESAAAASRRAWRGFHAT